MNFLFSQSPIQKLITLTSLVFFTLSSVAKSDLLEPQFRSEQDQSFSLDFDWGRQLINLTPHHFPSSKKLGNNKALQISPSRNGYRVIDSYDLDASASSELSFWPESKATGLKNQLWLQVGLKIVTDQKAIAARFASSKAAADALSDYFYAPMHARDLKNWSTGDTLTYSTTGGIHFFAGVGLPLASLNLAAIATGQFQIYIEKTTSKKVYVKITDTKIRSLALEVDATLASVDAALFSKYANAFSFLIDVSSQEGTKAYELLIRGNIAAVQKIARHSKAQSVQYFERSESRQAGRTLTYEFGIPYLYLQSWGESQLEEKSLNFRISDSTSMQVEYGIHRESASSEDLESDDTEVSAFYGASYQSKDRESRVQSKGYFGEFHWIKTHDSASPDDVHNSIDDLIELTGFGEALRWKVPQKQQDLGYTKLALRIHMNRQRTLTMLTNLLNKTRSQLVSAVTSNGKHFDKSDAAQIEEITSILHEMHATANKMRRQLRSGDSKAFAIHYAKFGQLMTKNTFVISYILGLAGAGVQVDFSIEGTVLSSLHASFLTTSNPQSLAVKTLGKSSLQTSTGRGLPTIRTIP